MTHQTFTQSVPVGSVFTGEKRGRHFLQQRQLLVIMGWTGHKRSYWVTKVSIQKVRMQQPFWYQDIANIYTLMIDDMWQIRTSGCWIEFMEQQIMDLDAIVCYRWNILLDLSDWTFANVTRLLSKLYQWSNMRPHKWVAWIVCLFVGGVDCTCCCDCILKWLASVKSQEY